MTARPLPAIALGFGRTASRATRTAPPAGAPVDRAAFERLQAEQVRLVEALRLSQVHLDESQRVTHVGSWTRETVTGAMWWSDENSRIFGIEPGGFAGSLAALLALVHPDDRERVARRAASLAVDDPPPIDYRIVLPDGSIRILREIGEVVRDPSGRPVRFAGTTQDITEAVAAEQERTQLVSAVEQTGDSIWMKDLNHMVTYVNPAFVKAYGYPWDAIVGRHARIVDSGHHQPSFFTDIWATAAAGGTWAGSIVNRRSDGTDFEVDAVISGIRDASGRLITYMQTDRDVTRERARERALESALMQEARERGSIEATLARIDSSATPEEIAAIACSEIVGLSNVASAFVVILEPDAGWVLAAEGRHAALLPAGSAMPASRLRYLQERADRGPWVEAWRPLPEDGAAGQMLMRTGLHSTAYAPFRGLGDSIGLIGIAAYDAASATHLVERLPALVTIGSIVGTLIGPRLGVRRHAAAERAVVQQIIDTTAVRPFFQPIVDLADGAVVGFEALTRFADGRPAGVVFATASRVGLGLELETACIRTAIRAARCLPVRAYLSLNASPELILSGGLTTLLASIGRPVVLEITEHVAIEDYEAVRRELAKLGPTIRLAVDDAGAGYASFRHILELAPEFVKIDIGLVRNVDTEPARQALIAGMGHFAFKRGLHLVAEGIETTEELAALQALGVPFGQGFLLGVPGDAEPWLTHVDMPRRPD